MFAVNVGVGLNLSNRQPTTCLEAILDTVLASRSMQPSAGGQQAGGAESQTAQTRNSKLPREVLLAHVMSHLDECFQVRVV